MLPNIQSVVCYAWLKLENNYILGSMVIDQKYNSAYHRAITMKPIDVKSSIYIDFNGENDKESSKFEVGDHGRISK